MDGKSWSVMPLFTTGGEAARRNKGNDHVLAVWSSGRVNARWGVDVGGILGHLLPYEVSSKVLR
jgi:hypothetical protein